MEKGDNDVDKQISFIHAADLHLDSPFTGMSTVPESIFQEIRNSTFTALERLVEVAIDKEVDFIVLVGDLFDNEKQSLKAQIRLRQAFEQLQTHGINIYVSYGNHDHLNGNIYPVTYPDNVFIFSSENVRSFVYKRDEEPLATIHGFSYENRAVINNKAKEYQVTEAAIPFHIATLHGSIQSNTDHDTYAPFKLSDLTEQPFDYWALGHIHKRSILKKDPYIVYPGNIQGRHRLETGAKGCYYVTLTKTKTNLTFIPLHALEINTMTMDVSECKEIHDLESIIQKRMKQTTTLTPQLIELILQGENDPLENWSDQGLVEDMIELVNETLIHQQNWNYIFTFSVRTKHTQINKELYKGDHFTGELLREFDEVTIQPFLKEVFEHRQGRKYLVGLNDKESEEIKSKAKQLLINQLLSS